MAPISTASPRCLVVEDEALIGMDLEDGLGKAGFDVRWVASTPSALEALATTAFDVAVVDIVVRSEACVQITRELRRRRVPFLIYSGYRRDDGLPEFGGAPWLEKPAELDALVMALVRIISAPDACQPISANVASMYVRHFGGSSDRTPPPPRGWDGQGSAELCF